MSDEPKLLPCPFCGADAEIDQSRDFRAFTSGNFRLQAAIYCTACNCDMCLCYDDLPECDGDQLEAILRENWNRRVPAPAVPDDVAAIAETLRKATFTKGRMRGGIGGQTIEANMRSTFHEVSAWDLDTAADALEAQAAELALLRADIDQGAKDYCDLMEQRDALHVRAKALEAALRPFVAYVHDDLRKGKATYELVAVDRHGGGLIGAEDLRRARAVLSHPDKEPKA